MNELRPCDYNGHVPDEVTNADLLERIDALQAQLNEMIGGTGD